MTNRILRVFSVVCVSCLQSQLVLASSNNGEEIRRGESGVGGWVRSLLSFGGSTQQQPDVPPPPQSAATTSIFVPPPQPMRVVAPDHEVIDSVNQFHWNPDKRMHTGELTRVEQIVHSRGSSFIWGTFRYRIPAKHIVSSCWITSDGELDLSFRSGSGRFMNDEDIAALCSASTPGYEAITVLNLTDNKDVTDKSLRILYESSIGGIRKEPQIDPYSESEVSVVTLLIEGTSITRGGIEAFNKKPRTDFRIEYIWPENMATHKHWKVSEDSLRFFIIKGNPSPAITPPSSFAGEHHTSQVKGHHGLSDGPEDE